MPKQGNTVEECVLTGWRVSPGDTVKEGDIIADIETDKATFEVEATAAGVVLERFWEEGDLVPVLVNICAVGEPGEDASGLRPESTTPAETAAPTSVDAPESAQPAATPAAPAAKAETATGTTPAANAPLSPRARAFLREHPFDLPPIQGSGAGGRIIEQDVRTAWETAARLSPAAAALRDQEGLTAPATGTGVNGMILAADMSAAPATAAAVAARPRMQSKKFRCRISAKLSLSGCMTPSPTPPSTRSAPRRTSPSCSPCAAGSRNSGNPWRWPM
jgi:pyruvate dehydrogenase E2 component (dihydrolipoamide acetyltransferase)